MRELDEECKKKGLVVLNEIGLDPGIDHLYAVKTIGDVHDKGGKVSDLSRLIHSIAYLVFPLLGQTIPFILWWSPSSRIIR